MPGEAAAKVVALLGVGGSGKSIVTRRLVERHGFRRVRFNDPVRDMLKAGFGLTDDSIDGYQRNQPQQCFGGRSIDNLMATLSRWSREHVHADAMAKEWRRRVDLSGPGFVVADDIMRPNEAAAVWAAGGIVIRITRPGFVSRDTAKAGMLETIRHNLELLNHGPEELAALTDQLVAGLNFHLLKAAEAV